MVKLGRFESEFRLYVDIKNFNINKHNKLELNIITNIIKFINIKFK